MPSPTFLLCLSYKDDLGHEPGARAGEVDVDVGDGTRKEPGCGQGGEGGAEGVMREEAAEEAPDDGGTSVPATNTCPSGQPSGGNRTPTAAVGPTVHHMDPYRLGAKADKMAGLIDFSIAFKEVRGFRIQIQKLGQNVAMC